MYTFSLVHYVKCSGKNLVYIPGDFSREEKKEDISDLLYSDSIILITKI